MQNRAFIGFLCVSLVNPTPSFGIISCSDGKAKVLVY